MALQSSTNHASSIFTSQSTLILAPSSYCTLHLLISFSTYFHYLFFGRLLSGLLWGLLLNIWLPSLSLSVLLRWPIQYKLLSSTSEIISKYTNSRINSSLYRFLLFSLTVISPHKILLKPFLSKSPPTTQLYDNQGHSKTMFWEWSQNSETFQKRRTSVSFSLLFRLWKKKRWRSICS